MGWSGVADAASRHPLDNAFRIRGRTYLMTRRRVVRGIVLIVAVALVAAAAWPVAASVLYSPEYVFRVLAWQESDVGDYLNNFPRRSLTASRQPLPFPERLDDARVESAFEWALGVDDLDAFLTETGSQSFIVIKDDAILFERYYNGWRRDSMVTSFSVAKSFVSTLVGIAIEEGAIGSLDDPITRYLPELAERDARFEAITIRHLLTMTSGLEYQETGWFLFNGDDPLTTYHPDQRKLALTNLRIAGAPGAAFSYNKYHPQLLGMILERTTGMSVTEWTQSRLWEPLGMEFDGAWTLDSESSGFEKMEAGLNARAIDFAKLGQAFLQEGRSGDQQIVSREWARLASGVDPAGRVHAFGPRYYALMWWGLEGEDPADFFALGDHGQFVHVSPSNDVVIVRTGEQFGVSSSRWINAFTEAATL
jgi:CubicO group peptidase (beta-lactamase class C family)